MKNKMNPETKKIIQRRILFIILFLIIAVGITVYLVLNNLPQNEDITISKDDSEKPSITEKVVDLDGTYDINDLNIKHYKEKYRGLDLSYYQIDGLKDNSIEISINYNLKNDLIKAIDKAFEEEKINIDDCSIYLNINSNFANTISVSYYLDSYIQREDGMNESLIHTAVCENYDLTTGNKIKLNDIFAKNAPVRKYFIKRIIYRLYK